MSHKKPSKVLGYWATPRGDKITRLSKYEAAGGKPIYVTLGARVRKETAAGNHRMGTVTSMDEHHAVIEWDSLPMKPGFDSVLAGALHMIENSGRCDEVKVDYQESHDYDPAVP
jgi:hypothetical protein